MASLITFAAAAALFIVGSPLIGSACLVAATVLALAGAAVHKAEEAGDEDEDGGEE